MHSPLRADMFRTKMPRVYELRALIADQTADNAYFQDFDNSVRAEPSKARVWFDREQVLQELDQDSWEYLKKELLPYLTAKSRSGRGWQQLITILNQAYAYRYLKHMGCLALAFISRATQRGQDTPDLEAELDGARVLCEVKTINISDAEVQARKSGTGRTTLDQLDHGFFAKLQADLTKASQQMNAYDDSNDVVRIVYLVPDFDDLLGEYKAGYYQQIDQHLAGHQTRELQIVFHNQATAFHPSITMRHASVVNEVG